MYQSARRAAIVAVTVVAWSMRTHGPLRRLARCEKVRRGGSSATAPNSPALMTVRWQYVYGAFSYLVVVHGPGVCPAFVVVPIAFSL